MTIFDDYREMAWPYRWSGRLHIARIAGGTPSDKRVAESWIRSKYTDKDELVVESVAKAMAERGITKEEATQLVDQLKHLNGFRRIRCPQCMYAETVCEDGQHQLYIEGRQLKASLKEAASVAANSGKITTKGYGNPDNKSYLKGLSSWLPEHVFVLQDRLPLQRYNQDSTVFMPVFEASSIEQRFVHTWRGTGIQYEEMVNECDIDFTVVTDYEFSAEQWAMIWLTGEKEGIGASRSQGYGTYEITKWEPIKDS
jgi:hypothetical protein